MRIALAGLFAIASAGLADAVEKPQNSDAMIIRQGIAKGWESLRSPIEARCKAEAKKRYYAVFIYKRRMFVKDCIERAARNN